MGRRVPGVGEVEEAGGSAESGGWGRPEVLLQAEAAAGVVLGSG